MTAKRRKAPKETPIVEPVESAPVTDAIRKVRVNIHGGSDNGKRGTVLRIDGKTLTVHLNDGRVIQFIEKQVDDLRV